jgi:hypothetical protein
MDIVLQRELESGIEHDPPTGLVDEVSGAEGTDKETQRRQQPQEADKHNYHVQRGMQQRTDNSSGNRGFSV